MKEPWRRQDWTSEPSQEKVMEAVYKHAADLIKAGLSGPQIESQLVKEGLDQESASIVVQNLLMLRFEAGKKNMLYGALWCMGGIIVTAVTYAAASEGGTYVIAFGAIVFGVIQFFRGFFQYRSQ